jgi:hypothetical protein
MNTNEVWKLLKSNLDDYKSLGLYVKHNSIDYVEQYYSENGEEYILIINDDTWKIGYCYIIEDSEDWAQAESFENRWFIKNGVHTNGTELLSILKNIKNHIREKKLSDILN